MKVLVVDDDPVGLVLARTVVSALGHRVETATSGDAAWALLEQEHFDVLVTDREMPGLDGVSLCQRLRSRGAGSLEQLDAGADPAAGGYCYVVVLTSHDSEQDAHEGISAGADDYLSKPLNGHELSLRLLAAQRVTDLHRQLSRRTRELAALGDAQHTLARRDPLTSLPNRLALQEHLDRLDAQQRRYGRGFSLAIFDVDHFKGYNDGAGHVAGDDALRRVAAALLGEVRDTDGLYRYGGEEFVHVIETASPAAARAAVKRLRSAVAALALPHPARPGELLSVSAGIASAPDGAGVASQALLGAADVALYTAKREGRDRARHADDVPGGMSEGRTDAPAAPSPTAGPDGRSQAPVVVLDPSPLERMQVLGRQIGRNLADEIVQTWLKQCEQRLGALQSALRDGDPLALRRAAHTLKGSSATVGGVALAAACAQLETSDSWPRRAQLVREAQELAATTNTALVEHLQSLLRPAAT